MTGPPEDHEDGNRRREAWELVRTARWAAVQLIPSVDQAANGIISRYGDAELPQADRGLSMALTVVVHVLSAMQSAVELLGWLDPEGVGQPVPPGPHHADG